MSIAVLLCTYNGARFLREQLDSLLAQTLPEFVVYVHDDGSSDGTVPMLSEYARRWPDRFVILEDPQNHRGASGSFMWLLSEVEAEYYFFCDQDDVWLPSKMQVTLDRMQEVEASHPGIPVLIHTDLALCDAAGVLTGSSFWVHQNLKVDVSRHKEYLAFGNIVTGCTMVINRALKEVAFPYDGITMHDYWLAGKAACCGVLDNLKAQTVHYRLHGDNVAGAGAKYDKRRINWRLFRKRYREEFARFRAFTGRGVLAWLYYRTRYFFYRHI